MREKLKPCPFCGCTGHIYQLTNGKYQIRCAFCEVRTRPIDDKWFATYMWNSRTGTKPKLAERLKKLARFIRRRIN